MNTEQAGGADCTSYFKGFSTVFYSLTVATFDAIWPSVQQENCAKVLFSMAPHPSFWWMQGGSSSC